MHVILYHGILIIRMTHMSDIGLWNLTSLLMTQNSIFPAFRFCIRAVWSFRRSLSPQKAGFRDTTRENQNTASPLSD